MHPRVCITKKLNKNWNPATSNHMQCGHLKKHILKSEIQRKSSFLDWFTLHMAAVAKDGSGQPKLECLLCLKYEWLGLNLLDHSLQQFPGY